MHDPYVVAFDIRRPWPSRSTLPPVPGPRWKIGRSKFWMIAGRELYWPPAIIVWHREPGGKNSGEVCKHYRRWRGEDGQWQSKVTRGWRWHVHHWRIQVPALQALRRRLLTHCAACGGRDSTSNPVDTSLSWDPPRGRWWRGEPGLFHSACAVKAHLARERG